MILSSDLVIVVTAVLVATAGALLGGFLVLRRMSLMADAISHSVLPGIVLAFWLTGGERATIPALLGAAALGLTTVTLVELITRSGLVKADAAIGLVFPALFSLGVLAVSRSFQDVHLDLDAVLYGEIAYAPFNPLVVRGVDLGPESLWLMGGLALANLVFVVAFYKELKLSTFDAGLAAALGFAPGVMHYTLMSLVSLTTVGAFQSVGAILVVAFLIVPAATAYLLTRRLHVLVGLAVLLGMVSAVAGYTVAVWLDASIAGAMATVAGLLFGLALLFSPLDGLLVSRVRQARQRRDVAGRLLVSHLHDQSGGAPLPVEVLQAQLGWTPAAMRRALEAAVRAGLAVPHGDVVGLTPSGREAAAALAAG